MTTNIIIFEKDNKSQTSSLNIAAVFGKNHKSVLRAIRNLECSEDFIRRNFAPVEYIDEKGESRPYYEMTKDGYSFLALGFTGKDAAEWKEKYIAKFNEHAEEVLENREWNLRKASAEWQAARLEGKTIRRQETDVIKQFVEYATGQGSTHANKYYISISQMENKALFFLEKAIKKPNNIRELLEAFQLMQLGVADKMVADTLKKGMNDNLHYKEIYQLAKNKIVAFAALSEKSEIKHTTKLLENHVVTKPHQQPQLRLI